ncbi:MULTISPECIES: acyl-CoA thioesterase [Enterococcus]|uniref:Acyl-CoA thioester hydrolase n=1 Tax=Enterococcus gilvus ATCC BAA-350 TaxID=1158614 RepID=R2VKT2_9ENTE|nr:MULTISPECIES: acyl-CoA thioesterase [Enterococcus]AXG40441.1 acyl-CoA thioesterase [Enterococcus gilvus]EOI58276.1 acyl-CoA thioester hydrolase [Enterococcus gilvus ATCC BAA-350]EOW78962.1 acyl-CoA thioester hydrolase [Enterococcus gilvus ATCC BAA-350]MDN6004276.1 acyl-CoA thioesterase [Enterococcus sp.]MDN6216731.1 acyl-CoA thioesterase [Enterococcus sp.]
MTEARTCRESRVIQTHRIFPFDLNPFGYLFGGKLMTLIDDAASIAISRHCRRGAVTASLDNLNFLKPLHANHSVCVKCYVSGSHNKSMEVFVKVIGEDLATGERYLAATCFTTFVAVPSHMNEEKQFTVPHVVPETEEEKMVCGGYEKRRNHRLKERTEYQNFAALLSTDLPWSDEGTGD